jgi:hypothetical protein
MRLRLLGLIRHNLDLLVLVQHRHSQTGEFKLVRPQAVSVKSPARMHHALMLPVDPGLEGFHQHGYGTVP